MRRLYASITRKVHDDGLDDCDVVVVDRYAKPPWTVTLRVRTDKWNSGQRRFHVTAADPGVSTVGESKAVNLAKRYVREHLDDGGPGLRVDPFVGKIKGRGRYRGTYPATRTEWLHVIGKLALDECQAALAFEADLPGRVNQWVRERRLALEAWRKPRARSAQ